MAKRRPAPRQTPTPPPVDGLGGAPGAPGGVFGLAHEPEQAAVVLVPAPWEATVTYGRGTAAGPEAIGRASDQVDLFDVQTGRPHVHGIAMLPADAEIRRASDETQALVERIIAAEPARRIASGRAELGRWRREVNQRSQWLNERVGQQVSAWLERDKLVGVVGGDHSTAYGSIAAVAERHPGLGVLQFDAHADLRVDYQGFTFSHASVMHQVLERVPAVAKLVGVGLRDLCEEEHERIRASHGRVVAFYDAEFARRLFAGEPFVRLAQQIASELPDQVYVSFDIDGLDPSLCPHTGTPVPGGLSFQQATAVLAAVVHSGRRLVGFDLCEVAPGPEGHEWDANVGARVLYQLIGWALRSHGTR